MFPITSQYRFQMSVTFTEANAKGVKEPMSFFAEIDKFAILGGSKRTIRKNGENGIGDADIMSEFYQARHFHNLIVTSQPGATSMIFQRIYDKQLPFEFSFTVRSMEPDSRFRFLQLTTKKARITKPPSTKDDGDTMNIKFSNPQIYYGHESGDSEVKEKI